jgi:biotin transport system substrate-specific component
MFDTTIRSLARPRVAAGIAIAFFALLTATTARITIPLPFTPVPITLQVLAVLLSGLVLGARGGAASQLLYLGAILAGAPLSASGMGGPGVFVGPTAGYLVGFVPAAYVTGALVENVREQGWILTLRSFVAGLAGVLVIYLVGMSWLAVVLQDWGQAFWKGVVPFIGVDLAKAVVAALVARGGRYFLDYRGSEDLR